MILGNLFKRAHSQLQQKKQAQPQKRMQPQRRKHLSRSLGSKAGAFGALGGLLGGNAWGSRKYNAMSAASQLRNRKRGCR